MLATEFLHGQGMGNQLFAMSRPEFLRLDLDMTLVSKDFKVQGLKSKQERVLLYEPGLW